MVMKRFFNLLFASPIIKAYYNLVLITCFSDGIFFIGNMREKEKMGILFIQFDFKAVFGKQRILDKSWNMSLKPSSFYFPLSFIDG